MLLHADVRAHADSDETESYISIIWWAYMGQGIQYDRVRCHARIFA
jgi:hypothetical protein